MADSPKAGSASLPSLPRCSVNWEDSDPVSPSRQEDPGLVHIKAADLDLQAVEARLNTLTIAEGEEEI